jgi:hypothetical protein
LILKIEAVTAKEQVSQQQKVVILEIRKICILCAIRKLNEMEGF